MVEQERKSRPHNSFVCKIFPVNPLSARFCGEQGGSANHNCKRIMDLEEKSKKMKSVDLGQFAPARARIAFSVSIACWRMSLEMSGSSRSYGRTASRSLTCPTR